ncbi:aminotransferase class I/II-fold pyridoxal phosphate-dependent enzyme [Staphylococcus hominis]|uniref:methionine gamma-lyase family protein n=1 Tax=Staphylococcus hominis TaxID=1290 RepID=UPI00066B48E4|nr:methionine gamma-lyase family protein [Staphylococcus hominis]MCI2840577.1 methionine gamma-lyase family protein [Staphylococcus hominis]MCI2878930.1 methionine gamma-lyase family protein [Staphylococcus hominis]MDS3832523.1 methionine gamma-lyase family protein [Staphylococcus hominis]
MSDIQHIVSEVEETLTPFFKEIEETAYINQEKVLDAFHHVKASENDLVGSTGYGYDDFGRDHLEEIYAYTFKAEDAIVRPQIISGTHAITLALQSTLKYGDELMYITGSPYDTLLEVIGVNGNGIESLKEHGVTYKEVALKDGMIDIEMVLNTISKQTKVIAIQRSKGYGQRPSITVDEIETAISQIKQRYPNVIIFVDNCYGEFVERREPIEVGADLIAGSLIKNPGGGLAKIGGYIAGRKDLIERCGYRLTAPGIGKEAGASLFSLQEMYQGFFLAPHVVSQSLKGSLFTSLLLEKMNMNTVPKYDAKRTDLIQTVQFDTKEQMIAFCQSIQHASPINAHFSPEPSYMPGYEDDVIMAAGTFVQGSSIELSADGPIRPPYEAYVQGGLTYEHVKIAVTRAVMNLKEQNLI